jgi:hypothetical protein
MREGDTGSVLALTRVLIGEKSDNSLRFVKSDSDYAAEISARGPGRCAPLGVVPAGQRTAMAISYSSTSRQDIGSDPGSADAIV